MEFEHSANIMNSVSESAYRIKDFVEELVRDKQSPFVLLKAKMFPDGNQWCALYGDNLQEGVAGFGDTPYKAQCDFDTNWYQQKLSN